MKKKSAIRLLLAITSLHVAGCAGLHATSRSDDDAIWLSVLSTNDVHGELIGRDDGNAGGLALLSGYVNALREVRGSQSVMLLDAGDMWQGTIESNLGEGAAVIEAYNALGYDAAAIGNHEFDFGPQGEAFIPGSPSDDPRGALKARAGEANFPLLAANLIDTTTGRPVDWPNVMPATVLQRAGTSVGVIGVTTVETLDTTIRANTFGLRIAALAPTIEREARRLRADGARLVIVVAHAGGSCDAFDDPTDLSTCETDDEVFALARALSPGLVNHIIAGHRHRGIAHVVNDIAITASYSNARAFGRVDYRLDPATGDPLERVVFAPHKLCRFTHSQQTDCADRTSPGAQPARYAGGLIDPIPEVVAAVDKARTVARALKEAPLGITLVRPVTRAGAPFSALGRMMTDAVRDMAQADVAIHNVVGGIRDNLPAGELTFGDVYRAFPFDNRLAIVELSGRELRNLLAHQVQNRTRRAGVSGLHIDVTCTAGTVDLHMTRLDGRPVLDTDTLRVAANDFLLLGGDGIFSPITPADGFELDSSQPLVRDIWVQWLRKRGGRLDPADYLTPDQRRWRLPATLPPSCKPASADSAMAN